MSVVDDAIKKYSKGNDQYAQTLKENIRNMMGYSNYMDKIKQDTSKTADIGDISGLSPEGIKDRMRTRFGMQNEDIATDQSNANAIDSAAGTIAASQVSAANKAKNDYRYDSSFIFHPNDKLDQDILNYAQNPFNDDGSTKSLQQFESEMRQKYGEQAGGQVVRSIGPDGKVVETPDPASQTFVSANGQSGANLNSTPAEYSSDDIKNRLLQRLPHDYIGNEQQYSFRFKGMGQKQAADSMLLHYADMISNGQGDKVPQELYPTAFKLLSDTEKIKVMNGNSLF